MPPGRLRLLEVPELAWKHRRRVTQAGAMCSPSRTRTRRLRSVFCNQFSGPRITRVSCSKCSCIKRPCVTRYTVQWSLGTRLRVSTSRRQRSSMRMDSTPAAKIMSKLLAQAMKLKTHLLATMSGFGDSGRPSTRTRSGRGPRTSKKCTNASLIFDNFVVVVFIFSFQFSVAPITLSTMNSELIFSCPGSLCSEILGKRHMTNRGQTPALPELDRETYLHRGADDESSTSPSL